MNEEILNSLAMKITVELGSLEINMQDLKNLGDGSVLQFKNHEAGKPFVIKCNGQPIGIGEIVVIDDLLGVRVIELFDKKEQEHHLNFSELLPYEVKI